MSEMQTIAEVCQTCIDKSSSGSEICSELSKLLPPGFKLIHESEEEVRKEIVQDGDDPVPITAEPGIKIDTCLSAKIYQDWRERLSKKFLVRGIKFQSLDMFGPRVGFIKMNVDLVARATLQFVPGITFLRGGAVAILIIISCEKEEWVLLTSQPRAPVSSGGLLELPAGMLDGSGNFAGVAAKEIKEETGLDIKLEDLVNISDLAFGQEPSQMPIGSSPLKPKTLPRGMYPSAGGCDEFINIFLHRTTMTRENLLELEGKLTGNLEEGEMITLKVLRYRDLWRVADSKALSAMALYEGLQQLSEFKDFCPEPKVYQSRDM